MKTRPNKYMYNTIITYSRNFDVIYYKDILQARIKWGA